MLGIRPPQNILLVRAAVFLLSAATPTPSLARSLARSQPTAVFRFFSEVHWGSAVPRPGDYVVTISAGATPVVTLGQKGGAVAATIAPKAAPNAQPQPPNPSSQYLSRQKAIPGDSASSPGSLFTIYNPRNQTFPHAEAQALYLAACKVVEQEFGRTSPVRPRLTLVLGAKTDRIYYPTHEIQLAKWDRYQFAQGVVILAMDDLLPDDMRISLTKLAVTEAESTVSVSDLKKQLNAPQWVSGNK